MPATSDPATSEPAAGPAAGPAEPTIAGPTIDRVWELRRQAEERAGWQRPAVAVLVAAGFLVIANPDLVPGGLPVALTAVLLVLAAALAGGVIAMRRAGIRGHSGSVGGPETRRHRWWRNPALAGPAMFAVVFLGNLVGAFDHWPVVVGCAIAVGCLAALALPRYETGGHIHGARLERVPRLSSDGEAAVVDGSLPPDVLELLVLQHHTGERRISWCADVLDTDATDIRGLISRGRRWLELPATEVHDPESATWVRLTADGREALGYS